MKPRRLQIKGFTCFREEQTIDFSDLSLFAIAGPTGSGKTSILDTIAFALYGKVPRVGKQGIKEFISLGSTRASVVLDFEVAEALYRVTRQSRRSGASTAQLERLKNGQGEPIADGITNVDAAVEKLLAIGYEAFIQTVLLPQGQFSKFIKAKPSDRRNILRELLRLEVYELMRKEAEKVRSRLLTRTKSLEDRLREDYADATQPNLETARKKVKSLESTVKKIQKAIAKQDKHLQELESVWKLAQSLDKVRKKQSTLEARRADVVGKRRAAEAARRAAPILPLLNAVEDARQKVSAADKALRAVDEVRKSADEHHSTAQDAVQAAKKNADKIPEIEKRVLALTEASALIKPLEAAATRVKSLKDKARTAETKIKEAENSIRELSDQLVQRKNKLAQLNEQRAQIAYDEELHSLLKETHEDALGLRHLRTELAGHQEEQGKKAKQLNEVKRRLVTAQKAVEEAQAVVQVSVERKNTAFQTLRGRERSESALLLRESLQPGDPCPVCLQPIHDVPPIEAHPELNQARVALEEAERKAQDAASAHSSAIQTLERTAGEMSSVEEAVRQLEDSVRVRSEDTSSRETRISTALADSMELPKNTVIEEVVIDQLSDAEKRSQMYSDVTRQIAAVESDCAAVEPRIAGAQALLTTLSDQQKETRSELLAAEQAHSDIAKQLAEVESDDPISERRELQARMESFQKAFDAAVMEARASEKAALAAAGKCEAARNQLEAARKDAANYSDRLVDDLAKAGFEDENELRRACLKPSEIESYESEVRQFEQEANTAKHQVDELTSELSGRTASAEQIRDAKAEREDTNQQLQNALTDLGSARQESTRMEEAIAKVKELDAELSEKKNALLTFEQLAHDLKSDHFQDFLLNETFRQLVEGASHRLFELTDRYTLALDGDDFQVVDHDNAQERRIADTLSGGETFLASLASVVT